MDFQSNHFAVLDVQYAHLDNGFSIIVTTDVPCHLYCRMTKVPPRKHNIPSGRRGTYLTGEIRFCFDVYEDNEQAEPGDTITHTFIKPDWPVCETRWFYFVATQGGTPSVSETAIFKFHYPAPPPEPPPLAYFVAANHESLRIPGTGSWLDLQWGDGSPLAQHLPVDTKVLFIHCQHSGANERLGFRPRGSTWIVNDFIPGNSHFWSHCALSDDIEADVFALNTVTQTLFLEGYARAPFIVPFTNPVDITPGLYDQWVNVSVASQCPGAIAILLEIYNPLGGWFCGCRHGDSADNRINASRHFWAIVGVNANQIVGLYSGLLGAQPTLFYLWGFIRGSAGLRATGKDVTPGTLNVYEDVQVLTPGNIAFLEATTATANKLYAMRKNGAGHDIYRYVPDQHSFAFVGLNADSQMQAKIGHSDVSIHLLGRGF